MRKTAHIPKRAAVRGGQAYGEGDGEGSGEGEGEGEAWLGHA
jgi:hypothetical protein